MRKSIIKIFIFSLLLIIIMQLISYIFIPNKSNLKDFGYYKKTKYDILSEPNDSIDVVFLGDSLVYNAISPMYLWNEFGFTSYDCALPAATSKELYEYSKIVVKSQKPKLAFIEGDVLFRSMRKNRALNLKVAEIEKYFPLFTFHNNWKQLGKDEWLNVYKGFRYTSKSKAVKKTIHIKKTNKCKKIDSLNTEYFKKIIKTFNDNNVQVIIIENPTTSWNYEKHNAISKFAEKNKVEVLDLNVENLNIDWKKETKDRGIHLNYLGARKVSNYIGNYIIKKNVLVNRKDDKEYDSWNKSYKIYKERLLNK